MVLCNNSRVLPAPSELQILLLPVLPPCPSWPPCLLPVSLPVFAAQISQRSCAQMPATRRWTTPGSSCCSSCWCKPTRRPASPGWTRMGAWWPTPPNSFSWTPSTTPGWPTTLSTCTSAAQPPTSQSVLPTAWASPLPPSCLQVGAAGVGARAQGNPGVLREPRCSRRFAGCPRGAAPPGRCCGLSPGPERPAWLGLPRCLPGVPPSQASTR